MKSLLECYNEIYETLNGFNSDAASIVHDIENRLKKRSEEIPARIENLQIRLKKIDEYESLIRDLIRLAKMHITSLNLPTIEVPAGYRINLNRLNFWANMIDPMSEDDVYAQRIYLVGSCDLEFLSVKREEYRAKIVQLDDDYNQSAAEEIKKLEEADLEIINSKNAFLESDEFTGFARRVIDEHKMCLVGHEDEPYEFRELPLDGTSDDKTYIKSLLGDLYDEDAGVICLPPEPPEEEDFKKESEELSESEEIPEESREDEAEDESEDESDDNPAGGSSGNSYVDDDITEFVKE